MRRTNWTLAVTLASASLVFACSGGGEGDGSATCATPCFNPPAAACDGDSVVTYNPLGECVAGACVYAPLTPRDCTADGQICVGGVCEAAPSACDDIPCDTPPASTCQGEMIRVYSSPGTCVEVRGEGRCNYQSTVDDCRRSERCVDGVCTRRPCWGVECIDAPSPTCEGEVVVTYEASGTCNTDTEECEYAEASRLDCAETERFCQDGRCVAEDPCADVICDEIPENYCDGNVLHTFGTRGTCRNGTCNYGERTQDCADLGGVCDGGACRDRLPCEGVVCDAPPMPYCDDDVAVTFGATGTCVADDCQYAPRRSDCFTVDQICQAGACVPPTACTGLSCEDPPENFCRGQVAVRFGETGTCSEGACRYTETTDDCAARGFLCFSGDCELDDPCTGVVCNTPPEPSCVGQVAHSYALPGECSRGECRYVEFTEDCALGAGVCDGGACDYTDPCDAVVCDTPPPASCIGNTLFSYAATTACVAGDCDWDAVESVTDCRESGLACFGARCVQPGLARVAGDLVVSEVMAFPAGGNPNQRWFEVYVPGGGGLGGLTVRNGTGASFVVPEGTVVVGDYAIFAASGGAAPTGADVVWPAEFTIDPAGDTITLVGAGTVDTLAWSTASGWTFEEGVTLQLSQAPMEARDNDARASWCSAPFEYEAGSRGTPKRPNGACSAPLLFGDLVVTEIMIQGNPRPGGIEEWFELYNASGAPLDLSGVRFFTTSGAFVAPTGTTIAADDYLVFGVDGTVGGGADVPYGTALRFADAGDRLVVHVGETVLEEVDYRAGTGGGWPFGVGRSMQLRSLALDNDVAANWCLATTTYPGFATNYGTPGRAGNCP